MPAQWLLAAMLLALACGWPVGSSDAGPASTQPVAASIQATRPASGPAEDVHRPRRVHVFVSGKVQGVGFRAFTSDQARIFKLTGFVLNLADGRVEAVVEGPADKVDKLLGAIRQGPAGSRVEKVEITEEPYKGEFAGFRINQ